MDSFFSILETGRKPTPDELYKAALFIDDAATASNALIGVDMAPKDLNSILRVLSTSIGIAAEVLALGLDPDSGTAEERSETT